MGYFKIWGGLTFVRLANLKRSKLDVRATTCVFSWIWTNNTTYRFLVNENYIIFELGDVLFHEEKISFKLKNNGCQETRENIISQPSSSTSILQNQQNNEIEPLRNKRTRVEKGFGPDYYIDNIEESLVNFTRNFIITWCNFLERGCKWWDKFTNF